MKYKKECVDRGRNMCRLRRGKKEEAVYGLMERRNVWMKERQNVWMEERRTVRMKERRYVWMRRRRRRRRRIKSIYLSYVNAKNLK